MRGRSINEAFIILDEAQNTTKDQMKMFLTRLGYDSKIVVNGDDNQPDLPKGVESGLKWARDRLVGVDSQIGCVEFSNHHIVRNPLIGKMLQHLEGPGPREETRPRRHGFYSQAAVA
jgi:phosphate starvation-inducible PhoH-like protein